MNVSGRQQGEDIAVVGAACRFPGHANTLNRFWDLLISGTDAVTTLVPEKFSLERFCGKSTQFPGHAYTTCAGILPDLKDFDSGFFGISRKEAMAMDPQQRLALEMAWEALESAHIKASAIKGSDVGVFMGASNMDSCAEGQDDPAKIGPYAMTGTTLGLIANRISYFFDLHGPSMMLDTACSSSLVAVHQACQALRRGEISLALAGGVNAMLAPMPFIGFSRARMLSPDGRCKVFDASGNGYVRSEGGGVIVLKRLDEALRDKDPVLALVAGSGVNSDGRTTGIALPNQQAQEDLLRKVYREFSLDPAKLVYVEAHGTGTAAGDPLEAGAIGNVLGRRLCGARPLPVGSVKSNIGHLEPASGIAGLIKSLLVFRHGVIPPNLHFKTPNPAIDFEGLNIRVPVAPLPLSDTGGDELISINSFGFGGTNAHVVLRKAGRPRRRGSPARGELCPPLFLSARSENSLRNMASEYAALLESAEPVRAYDAAATLACKRDALDLRAVVSGANRTETIAQLKKLHQSDGPALRQMAENALTKPGPGGLFVFSGNGSQWPGMGRDLLDRDPVFREALEEVDALLARYQDWSVPDMLRSAGANSSPNNAADAGQAEEEAGCGFDRTEKSQPLLFAMQVGLVRSLQARGLTPSAVMGHSVGEVAAAWTAGALSLEDAVTVIHYRSLLQAPLRGQGGMAVASASVSEARALLRRHGLGLEITAENSPSSLTLAGSTQDLKTFLEICKSAHVAAKMLSIPYPFHTVAMESVKPALLEALQGIRARRPKIAFYSTALAGKRNPRLGPDYWWRNVRQPVLFAGAAQRAWDDGLRMFLEVGPSPVLRSYLRDSFRRLEDRVFVGAALISRKNEAEELDKAWKTAWQHGWPLDMARHFPLPFTPARLPEYCWDHEYLNEETTSESREFKNPPRVHPLLGWALPGKAPLFENTLHLADHAWLADHVAGSGALMPAAAFVEIMLAAAARLHPSRGQQELEWLSIFRPLPLPADGPRVTRVSVDREDGGLLFEARPYLSAENHAIYARCRIAALADSPRPPRFDLARPESFGLEIDKRQLYATARRFNLRYGPAFQTVDKAWLKADAERREILARLKEGSPSGSAGMLVPPPLLDGAFQTLFMLLSGADGDRAHSYLPSLIERVTFYDRGQPAFALARLEKISPRSVIASFHILDESGNTLAHLRNCRFRRAAWLEHERPPASAYAMRLMPGEGLEARQGQGSDIAELAGSLEYALRAQLPRETNPYLLLQLSTLHAMYETVASLPGLDKIATGFTVEERIRSGDLAQDREQWLRAMLERLEAAELAQRNGEEWQLLPRGDRVQATVLWRTLMSSSSGFLPEGALLAHVFRRGRDILRGAFTPETGKAVPERLLDAYFINSLSLQPFARAVRRCVNHVLSTWKGEEPVRILQLARNSEAVLFHVLPLLDHARCRYVVGERDEASAEARSLLFDYNPALSFLGLNAEHPDPKQCGRYDLIIAAHSIHTRLNSSGMLAGCLAMLAPGGILCMVEHTPDLFTDYVFGADTAWWEAAGDAKLPVSLMQDESYWRSQLELTGFRGVRGLDLDGRRTGPAFVLLAAKPDGTEQEGLGQAPSQAQHQAQHQAQPQGPDQDKSDPPFSLPWLVAVGKNGSESAALGGRLVRLLQQAGAEAELAHVGGRGASSSMETLKDAWKKTFAGRGAFHLLYAVGYDSRGDLDLPELAAIQRDGICALAALASAFESARPDMRLWVLTGGALADGSALCRPVPSQGALCGFSRVLANEMRTLPLRLVDLHGGQAAWEDQAPALLAVLSREQCRDREPEIVIAGGKCLVPRLDRHRAAPPQQALPGNGEALKHGAVLAFDEPGRLQNLHWKKMPLPAPGPGQVCVEVKYAGLNFRDVMWSMGLLQDEALENGFSGPGMGIECSGVIVALGEGVDAWNAGDEVVCFAPVCFSSHVLTSTSALARKPENLSFAEAATIPVPFFTAWYSLKHLARLRPGERVLIHGAAGGVGLAAVQIASLLGLEIYATAGAPEKHNFLRQLGVRQIFSSRSTAFARQIMDATQGQGVDAVLNSLAGEYISAGLSVLRPFGRFLELGKRDFYADTPMRLRPFSNNLSYFGVDVDQLLVHQPELGQELFGELMDLFAERKLAPLPHTVYPCYKTVDAFRVMQQSSHIGKLVVSMEGAARMVREEAPPLKEARLDKDALYVISGGAGGFGLATARHLAARGAGHLLLLSRGGLRDEESRKIAADLRDKGVKVTAAKVDVADAAALGRTLKRHLKDMPRLAGVVHAAAVLDDGMINSLTPERVDQPLRAKTHGAWNLHKLTLGMPLDFFLLYSSATTPFGNPGQSVYVAGNCMLESLCAWRRSQGLPAQVIGWGPIDDTGMLTRNPKARQMLLKVLGISPIATDEAMLWLDNVLAGKVTASHYFGLDWNNRADLPVLRNPRFSILRPQGAASQGSEGPSLDDIRACAPQEAVALIAAMLTDEIAHVLRMPKDRLAPDLSLVSLGMDSLTSVELGLAVEQRFELTGYTLPLSEKTTTLSLAQSLYAVICGAGAQGADEETEDLSQAVSQIVEKHGVTMSAREKSELIEDIKKR